MSPSSELTFEDYRLLEKMRAGIEGLEPESIPGDDPFALKLRCRNIALEHQNAVLWAKIDEITKSCNSADLRAERWRTRWALSFGLNLIVVAALFIYFILPRIAGQ